MNLPVFWNEIWTAALINHLWQSTLFVLIAWLAALMLRNNQAWMRYWVWMIASIKFLFPFSLLINAGEFLRRSFAAHIQNSAFAAAMEQIAQPFPQTPSAAVTVFYDKAPIVAASPAHLIALFLPAVWLCGFLAVVISWARMWIRIRGAVHSSPQVGLLGKVPVLSSTQLLEPAVFGIFRPVLLLPVAINDRISESQLNAIVAHEMCHIRRRDNLSAAIHMIVQAAFWFHPAVWWIKARLMEERERACDEAVLQSGTEAQVYAESILNVCKFCVESPLACTSGVSGSDLKQRIVRIMAKQIARKLDFSRKLLLSIAGIAVLALPVILGLAHTAQVHAQATAENPAKDITGTWQGTLSVGRDLRIVIKVSKADGDGYKGLFYSIDQSGDSVPAPKITLDGTTVKMSIAVMGGTYEGKLSADGKTITGNWSQGPSPMPLNLTRATAETEWTIPAPTPKLPQMDPNATPSFEVATIKPSKPDEQGKAFLVQGNRFRTINVTLSEMIAFAYGVHPKQIIGAPPWTGTDKYDIEAKPEGEGTPSEKQWKGMLQKLMADRFKLSFHREKKELSVYALSVGKTGSKLTKSAGDPNGLPGLFFRELGNLHVTNGNMTDFTNLMQEAVLDRPVVDQTGLAGRFDFDLNWTPDDSQFAGMGARIPPPADGANAPPPLYTAIQEQIGLKLDATKAPAEVLVIDHVEKASEN
jgi:uncharacterized protein (TIGR03435 family)